MRAIGWYLWNDPLVRVSVTDRIPKTNMEVEIQWPRQTDQTGMQVDLRQGEYNDLNFEVVPYSMVDQSPAGRLQVLQQIYQEDVMPSMQFLVSQGITINMQEYLERIEEYANMPELSSIIQMSNQPLDGSDETTNLGGNPLPKPPNTTRQYDRVVRPQQSGSSNAQLISGMTAPQQPGGAVR
jgi:hypothetical protein